MTQRRARLDPGAVVGEGKLKELAEWTGGTGVVPVGPPKASGAAARRPRRSQTRSPSTEPARSEADRAGLVLVDHELTPSQARNLERATGAEVLDRTAVILAIFQRHARSREARLQVEIARLAYIAPRLRETGGGRDREGGGIGGRGAGESASELDRRKVRDRIAELRAELAAIEREAGTRRKRRAEQNTVALVGYTNAGKSSWMRALTGSDVLVEDKLFATLGTTVRALQPEGATRVLVSDTVGFIKQLPHDLVASFRSTLDEARESDLLLHVVDASDPAFEAQIAVTCEVLARDRRRRDPAPDRAEQGRPPRRRGARARSPPRTPTRCCSRRSAPRTPRRCARRCSPSSSATSRRTSSSFPTRSSAWSPRRTRAATCSRRPTTPRARACACAPRARCSRACARALGGAESRLPRAKLRSRSAPDRPIGSELRCAEVGVKALDSDGARSGARARLVDDHRQHGLHRARPRTRFPPACSAAAAASSRSRPRPPARRTWR